MVIGGGVIGCASALALASRGADVVLVERGDIGGEASGVAAGILGGQIESGDDDTDDALLTRVRARDGYGAWCAELTALSGEKTGHARTGVLSLAMTEDAHAALARTTAHHVALGLRAEMLDPQALHMKEPCCAHATYGAAFFQDDGQVEPLALMRALGRAISLDDRIAVQRTNVREIAVARDLCVGAECDGGRVSADAVVVCAGSFTKLLASGRVPLPNTKPVRGQLVTLQGESPGLSHIIFSDGGYVVPRGDGRLVCGTTTEHVGFTRGPTAEGTRDILEIAHRLVPPAKGAAILQATSGFRPYLANGPLVEQSQLAGLFIATGHYRNGILLAKDTAEQIAKLVLGHS
jgi:glycine oxidase